MGRFKQNKTMTQILIEVINKAKPAEISVDEILDYCPPHSQTRHQILALLIGAARRNKIFRVRQGVYTAWIQDDKGIPTLMRKHCPDYVPPPNWGTGPRDW